MPGVVTGKPLEIGGSRGRVEATGRGVTICALDEMSEMGLRPEKATIAIQGFGNVGSYAAKLFEERGCKVVGISDVTGAYYNEEGIYVDAAMEHVAQDRHARRLQGRREDHQRRAACERLRRARAGRAGKGLHAGDGCQSAGEADRRGRQRTDDARSRPHLQESGIIVIPDIMANAGGVTVSYFEWVQDRMGYFWKEAEVNEKLEEFLAGEPARNSLDRAVRVGATLRTAAYTLAIDRVVKASKLRGIYA